MFKLGKFEVFFHHYPEEFGFITNDEPGFENNPTTPYRGRTECIVALDKEGELLTEGESYCSIRDRFDKAVGRKVSLARAIEGFDKELREEFWMKYIETSRRL